MACNLFQLTIKEATWAFSTINNNRTISLIELDLVSDHLAQELQ